MNGLTMVFELVRKFVPMKPEDYAQLRNEGEEWESKLKSDSENKLEQMYTNYARKWGARLGFAVLYLVLLRRIPMWINPTVYEEKEEFQ